jgi:protein-disulfide isomerase
MNDPIASIHPSAVRAASYGVCVAKLAGSTAFFSYAASVFDGQDGLGTEDGATLTINSSLVKAGVDQAKAKACAESAETKEAVQTSIALANELQINQVPTLVINGRAIGATAPYETLKKVIDFQIAADGIK